MIRFCAMLFLLLSVATLTSCNSSNDDNSGEKLEIFDPGVPGGSGIGSLFTYDVIGLKSSATTNSVQLEWNIPSMYRSSEYRVHIYRVVGDGENFTLPKPGQIGSTAFLYYPRIDFTPFKGSIYIDSNGSSITGNLAEGGVYTYIVHLERNGTFSQGVRVTTTIPKSEEIFITPNNTTFWKNYSEKNGVEPDPNYFETTLATLDPGPPTLQQANGGMAFARNNMVLYKADTQTRRVMIYVNPAGLNCYQVHQENTFDFDLCIALYGNAPLIPYGVLGQTNFNSKFSCQDSNNPLNSANCLTCPTQLLVHKNKLLISDACDNRVKIYDTLPTYGCYNILNLAGDETPNECAPSRVIGQRRIDLIESHLTSNSGDASLKCPNGLGAINDNVYIADTCNNRIVLAKNALNPNLWNCSEMNWRTSLCVFGGLLGQANYFSSKTFNDAYLNSEVGYDQSMDTITGDTNFLKRYFANPKTIKITSDYKMFVSSEEDFSTPSPFGDIELKGRVLRFDSAILEGAFPACTETTFPLSGCDANWVYGQRGFTSLHTTPIGGQYYDNYIAIERVGGVELVGERLFITDSISNKIHYHLNFANNSVLGSPPTIKIDNPQGVWDPDNNRYQPNLESLSTIQYNDRNKRLYIMDSGHWVYQILMMNSFQ